ncbi:MAG: dihydrolipoamide acetyltransferase family protein [Candidatus Promineifilaceae bacterium]|nr:dihydrolipoamide acetyltransferase family protein [Candidatus Promineifilaceae bacterium]
MQIVMPKLGLTMTEGMISRWLVSSGQSVKQGDVLFEFESEKSQMEFESPQDGVIGPILVGEGETVPCGTILTNLETNRVVEEAVMVHNSIQSTGIYATPAAKRRARELGIDLSQVNGRGIKGRIHLVDVEGLSATEMMPLAAPETRKEPASPVNATPLAKSLAVDLGIDLAGRSGSGPGGRLERRDVLKLARTAIKQIEQETDLDTEIHASYSKKEALHGVRKIIAQRMSSSSQMAAHVTLHSEIDATNLVEARQQLNEELAGKAKISYNTLLIAIAARVLREQPQLNACLIDDEIISYADINIALAVDTERGLFVPVIHRADQRHIVEIQQQGDELIQRALAGSIQPDDLSGGTFTITNLGMFGIDAFTPIINQPQAAILGVGRIVNKPVGLEGELVLRDQLTLSLSFDHRIVDGAPAARFLQRIGQLIERPFALFI